MWGWVGDSRELNWDTAGSTGYDLPMDFEELSAMHLLAKSHSERAVMAIVTGQDFGKSSHVGKTMPKAIPNFTIFIGGLSTIPDHSQSWVVCDMVFLTLVCCNVWANCYRKRYEAFVFAGYNSHFVQWIFCNSSGPKVLAMSMTSKLVGGGDENASPSLGWNFTISGLKIQIWCIPLGDRKEPLYPTGAIAQVVNKATRAELCFYFACDALEQESTP